MTMTIATAPLSRRSPFRLDGAGVSRGCCSLRRQRGALAWLSCDARRRRVDTARAFWRELHMDVYVWAFVPNYLPETQSNPFYRAE